MNRFDHAWIVITGVVLFSTFLSFPRMQDEDEVVLIPKYDTTGGFWEAIGKREYGLVSDVFAEVAYDVHCYMLGTGGHGLDSTDRMPTNWILLGSSDGHEWMILDNRSGEKDWKMNENRYYNMVNPSDIEHVKLRIISSNENDIVRLYRFRLVRRCPS